MRAICLYLFLGLLILAHPCSAESLQDKMKNYYSKMESFAADFTQTLEHKESGAKEARKGKLSFKKPLLIRWQTAKPNEELLIVNAKEIWDYLPDEELAYRYSPQLAQDSRSIIQVITGQSPLSKDFDVKEAGSEKGLSKLQLYPREPTTQMVEALIWVDPATGQIKRSRIIDFYGNANDVALENVKTGPSFGPKEFTFTPPKGVEVEDRIDKDIPERELFK